MKTHYHRQKHVEAVQVCWRNWNDVCDVRLPGGDPVISPENPGRSVVGLENISDSCGELNTNYIEITVPAQTGALPGKTVASVGFPEKIARHGDWLVKQGGVVLVYTPWEFELFFEPAPEASAAEPSR